MTDLNAGIARKFNLPPSYVLIHRVSTAGIGVLCQLECEGPFRAEVVRWVPGYADPAPAAEARALLERRRVSGGRLRNGRPELGYALVSGVVVTLVGEVIGLEHIGQAGDIGGVVVALVKAPFGKGHRLPVSDGE